MKLVTAITTYNRVDYLRQAISTWDATRNKAHHWSLIVADDGSTDGTLDYLANLYLPGVELYVLFHQRRGVHHQTNDIFRLCRELDYDVAFKTDDDLVYLKPGWDEAYIHAIRATGYDHLVFYDRAWGRNRRPRSSRVVHSSGLLECWTHELQGAFWTFTPRVLDEVGYIDLEGFGLCGLGHTDYSYRCCRAGFNDLASPFDVANSNVFIALVPRRGYRQAPSETRARWTQGKARTAKEHLLTEPRVYISHRALPIDLSMKQIAVRDISFIVPLRGREEQIPGLLRNLDLKQA